MSEMGMSLPTLDQFLNDSTLRNSYVKCSGFAQLYVRKGPRYIDGERVDNVLDIANVEASRPGYGTFTRLIARLRHKYPDLTIYVESVLNQRMWHKLPQLGFRQIVDGSQNMNYVLWPERRQTDGHR